MAATTPIKLGKAIRFSRADLETAAQITEADIQVARDLWIGSVPGKYKSIMDAQAIGAGEIAGPILWDAQNRRYVNVGIRQYIPFMTIRNKAVESMIKAAKQRQRGLSSALQAGNLRLAEWQQLMMSDVKHTQLAAGLAANGGTDNTSQTDYRKIAAGLLLLYLFLQTFGEDIESGQQPLNGLLLVRSDLYASAARDSFEETRRNGMMTYYGAGRERRVLDPAASHCQTQGSWTGCPELAALSWVPIGTLPRLFDTPCRTNCKCHFDYQYQAEDGNWIDVPDDGSGIPAALLALILAARKKKNE